MSYVTKLGIAEGLTITSILIAFFFRFNYFNTIYLVSFCLWTLIFFNSDDEASRHKLILISTILTFSIFSIAVHLVFYLVLYTREFYYVKQCSVTDLILSDFGFYALGNSSVTEVIRIYIFDFISAFFSSCFLFYHEDPPPNTMRSPPTTKILRGRLILAKLLTLVCLILCTSCHINLTAIPFIAILIFIGITVAFHWKLNVTLFCRISRFIYFYSTCLIIFTYLWNLKTFNNPSPLLLRLFAPPHFFMYDCHNPTKFITVSVKYSSYIYIVCLLLMNLTSAFSFTLKNFFSSHSTELSPTSHRIGLEFYERIHVRAMILKQFMSDNFHILSLITMLIVGVIFHSWMALFFLLVDFVACKNATSYAFVSQFVVVLSFLLLGMTYISNLVNNIEWPPMANSSGSSFVQIGFIRYDYPFLAVLTQLVCVFVFALSARLSKRVLDMDLPIMVDSNQTDFPKITYGLKFLSKIWAVVTILILFLTAYYPRPTLVSAFYLLFVFVFIYIFRAFPLFWLNSVSFFWWFFTLFSILVTILLYTCQFPGFLSYWSIATGMETSTLHSIGISSSSDKWELLLILLMPSLSILSLFVQIYSCNYEFIKFITLIHDDGDNDASGGVLRWIGDCVSLFVSFLRVHINSLVVISGLLVSCYEHTPLGFSYILVIILYYHFYRIDRYIGILLMFWAIVISLIKFVYSIPFVPQHPFIRMCPHLSNLPLFNSDSALWFGLSKQDDAHLPVDIIVVLAATLQAVFNFRRKITGRNSPKRVFSDTSLDNDVTSFTGFVKYFIDFAFIKYGLYFAQCLLCLATYLHSDIISALYFPLLFVITFCSADSLAKVWRLVSALLSLTVLYSIGSSLGLPPFMCQNYPWDHFSPSFHRWLLLPSYRYRLKYSLIPIDIIIWYFFALQDSVIRRYRSEFTAQTVQLNPSVWDKHDFVSNKKTVYDFVKCALLIGGPFFSVVMLLVPTDISIISLSYLVSGIGLVTFYSTMDHHRIPKLIHQWNIIIFLVLLIMSVKVAVWCLSVFWKNYFLEKLIQLHLINLPASYHSLVEVACFVLFCLQRAVFRSPSFFVYMFHQSVSCPLAIATFSQLQETKRESRERENYESDMAFCNIKTNIMNISANLPSIKTPRTHYEAVRSWNVEFFELLVARDSVTKNWQNEENALQNVQDSHFQEDGLIGDIPLDKEVRYEEILPTDNGSIPCENDVFVDPQPQSGALKNYIDKKLGKWREFCLHYSNNVLLPFSFQNVVSAKVRLEMGEDPNSTAEQGEHTDYDPDHSRSLELCLSTFMLTLRFLLAQTELLCYLLIVINQMVNPLPFTLPLSFLLFLYALLKSPQPATLFWRVAIYFVVLVILCKFILKYFLVNQFLSLSQISIDKLLLSDVSFTRLVAFDIFLLTVLHFHRLGLQHTGLWYQTTTRLQGERSVESHTSNYMRPILSLYDYMAESTVPERRDYYTLMFFFDFLAFLVSIFGFWGFSRYETHTQVQQYILSNKVPLDFLILLVIEFFLILLDRIIYVHKSVIYKLLFYLIGVVIFHVWIFTVLPITTQIPIRDNTPALIWYFFKCLYFYISSLQIRSQYPRQILRVCFTRNFTYISLGLYKLYMIVPFLHEIRMTMDWVLTRTTLSLYAWIQSQGIYEEAFVIKCYRQQEKRYVQYAAEVLGWVYKFFTGGLLIIFIIFVVWFPLLLFSFNIYDPSPPKRATFSFKLTLFEPWLKVADDDIPHISEADYLDLHLPRHFLDMYGLDDVSRLTFYTNRSSVWGINRHGLATMIDVLNSNTNISFNADFLIDRIGKINQYSVAHCKFAAPLDNKLRSRLALNLTQHLNFSFTLANFLPPYIVINKDSCHTPGWLDHNSWRDVVVNHYRSGTDVWWELNIGNVSMIHLLSFNSRISSKSYSMLTNYGIIGLYAYVVIVISRFMRTYITGASNRIMFQELPNVDRLMQLCTDISNAREFKEFELEEYLFATLIMIYRSPELLVRFTKD